MKRRVVATSLMALMVLPVFGQDKVEDRVKNAGIVISEIMNLPDDIPQSVIDKADCVVVLPSVLKFAIGIGGSYLPQRQKIPRILECAVYDGP
jgi:lipid-binding SYLF domain-containing protein